MFPNPPSTIHHPKSAWLIVGLCVFSVWHAANDATGYDLSRGRQILLNRGLQIQALAFPGISNVSRWENSNFTTINFWQQSETSAFLSQLPANTQWGRSAWPGGAPITLTGIKAPWACQPCSPMPTGNDGNPTFRAKL